MGLRSIELPYRALHFSPFKMSFFPMIRLGYSIVFGGVYATNIMITTQENNLVGTFFHLMNDKTIVLSVNRP